MKRTVCALLAFIMVISMASLNARAETDEHSLTLDCKAAVLMNAQTGQVLYAMNENERLPEASITKVMTLLLVFEALDAGKIGIDDVVTCSPHAAGMGGSQIWLKEGEQMTVDDLLKAAAVGSANDASVALAEHVAGSHESFVVMMNDRARQLGMTATSYKNCTGLDAQGHLTSAIDVAVVSAELINHEKIFDYCTIWVDTLRDGQLQLTNTNKLLKSYDGITGLKTGTTSQAGCCVTATAERDGMTLIAVVMGAPNSKTRFSCAKKLLDYGFAGWEIANASDHIPKLEDISVTGGMEHYLPVYALMDGTVLTEKGGKQTFVTRVEMDDTLSAPVEPGQTVGKVILESKGKMIGEYRIVTGSGTEQVTFGRVFVMLLKELLRV